MSCKPPEQILPLSKTVVIAISKGMFSGIEGTFHYRFDPEDLFFKCLFLNPVIDRILVNHQVEGHFQCQKLESLLTYCHVTFVLSDTNPGCHLSTSPPNSGKVFLLLR
jgi:hypothetical protein